MKNNYLPLCVALAVCGLCIGANAQTQGQSQMQTKSATETKPAADDGAYTLKVPGAPASQVSEKGYELKSTTISGTSGSSPIILTAPVGGAAAYKTESGLYFYPSLFAALGYNDNLLSSASNPISSSVFRVAPQLIAEMKHKGDRFTALASVNNISYASSSPDNATNSEVRVAGDHFFTARARSAWSFGQVRNTEARGSSDRPVSAEADRWTSNNAEGRFIYGAPEAKGRLEFDLGINNKTFDNNRAVTAISDVNATTYAARMFYRMGGRLTGLGEYRHVRNDFTSSLSTNSNIDRRYYVGFTWDATAATTGIVKVGRMTKDFDSTSRQNYAGDSWEASLRWMPLTYSTFDLQSTRSTNDPTGLGTHNLVTSTNLSWNHMWTRSLSSRAALGQLQTEYVGTPRSDNATNYSLSVEYAVMRWLKLGVDWANTDSTSNVPNASFKRNVTMFTVNASL